MVFLNIKNKAKLVFFGLQDTVIWMPDRSADKRFGSCAAFVIEGTFLQWNEATAKAKVLFPWAWKRIDATAPIHLFGDKSNEEKL